MLKRTAVGALAALLCAGTALAQAGRAESLIFKDVARAVTSYPRFTMFDDVSAGVDGGVVTLAGKVTMPYKAGDLEARVAQVVGVRRVRNEIQVLPASLFDASLRVQLARAIYDSSAFWSYATMVNPPIHILVENGNVTLTGVVSNNVERTLALSLASSCGGLLVRSELKTDAELRSLLGKVR
jgi:hyperosmotically inducible periplasmic protein